MNKTKFTPGPWVADERIKLVAVYPEARKNETNGMHMDDDRNIMCSYKEDLNEQEVVANALLVAAAPEMYEVLHIIVDQYDGFPDEVLIEVAPCWLSKAQAALKKARGES